MLPFRMLILTSLFTIFCPIPRFTQNAFALYNASPLSGFEDLVRIKLNNGWICTGFFINSTTILTAAHCITEAKNPSKEPFKEPSKEASNELLVDEISTSNDQPLPVKALALVPHPQYKSQGYFLWWHAYDVGIIKTTVNQNFKGQFIIQNDHYDNTGKVQLFGCGRTKPQEEKYRRTTGFNSYLRVGSILFLTGTPGETLSDARKTNAAISPNDSGGPMINLNTGKVIAVATTSTIQTSISYGLPILFTGTTLANEEMQEFLKTNGIFPILF